MPLINSQSDRFPVSSDTFTLALTLAGLGDALADLHRFKVTTEDEETTDLEDWRLEGLVAIGWLVKPRRNWWETTETGCAVLDNTEPVVSDVLEDTHCEEPEALATLTPAVPLCDNMAGEYCPGCRSTGLSHCSDPEHCGGMVPMKHHAGCVHMRPMIPPKETNKAVKIQPCTHCGGDVIFWQDSGGRGTGDLTSWSARCAADTQLILQANLSSDGSKRSAISEWNRFAKLQKKDKP